MESENLQKHLETLPKEYKQAIVKLDLPSRLLKISKTVSLHFDQTEELELEITLTLLGLRSSIEFVENIEEKLRLDEETLEKVTNEVNNEIFLPFRNLLQADPAPDHHMETPDEILKHIEDGGLELPAAIPEPTLTPIETVVPVPVVEESKDLTDHLLKNTVASPHVEETKVEKKYTIDPYREPIM